MLRFITCIIVSSICVNGRNINCFDKTRVQNITNSNYFVRAHNMKAQLGVVEQLQSLLTLQYQNAIKCGQCLSLHGDRQINRQTDRHMAIPLGA